MGRNSLRRLWSDRIMRRIPIVRPKTSALPFTVCRSESDEDAVREVIRAARKHRKVGSLDKAERVLQSFLETHPGTVEVWRLRAKIAEKRFDWKLAIHCWKKTLEAGMVPEVTVNEADSKRARRMVGFAEVLMGAAGRDLPRKGALWLVDSGIDSAVVGISAETLSPELVVVDGRALPAKANRHCESLAIEALLTEGDANYMRLANLVAADGNAAFDSVLSALPTESIYYRGVEIGEALRYDFNAAALQHLRVFDALQSVIHSPRFTSAVFVVGEGRLSSALLSSAIERFGSDRVHLLHPNGSQTAVEAASLGNSVEEVSRLYSGLMGGGSSSVPDSISSETVDVVRNRPCIVARRAPIYSATLAPVARELARVGAVGVLSLPGPPKHWSAYESYSRLHEEGYPVHVDHRFALGAQGESPSDARRARCGIDLVPTPTIDLPELGALEGVRHLVESETRRLIGKVLPSCRRFAASFDDYLTKHSPSVVVTAREKKSIDSVAIRLANAHGIPTVTVQPLLDGRDPIFPSFQARVVTAFDSYAANLYTGYYGVTRENVEITGFPRFDSITSQYANGAQRPVEDLQILLAMQLFSLPVATQLIKSVAVAAVATRGDVKLLVRPHPRESAARTRAYRQVLAHFSSSLDFEVSTEGSLHEHLVQSTAVVSGWSNALVEAALSGCPAIAASLSGEPLPVPLDEMGIARAVYSEREMVDVLPQLVADTPFREEALRTQRGYFEDNQHLLRGPSSATRIARVICAAGGLSTSKLVRER